MSTRTTEAEPVVVGYDGSAAADRALDWAADEASRREVSLVVVTAAGVPEVVPLGAGPWLSPDALDAARRLAQEGEQAARQRAPELRVTGRALAGGAGHALVEASRSASLVVVGVRGRGSAERGGDGVLPDRSLVSSLGRALGSVSAAVAAHAACPVVVVHDAEANDAGPRGPVVVGVDGSRPSVEAVRHAAETAASTGARLVVVSAWDLTTADTWVATLLPGARPAPTPEVAVERLARAAVQAATSEALLHHPLLRVEQRVVRGSAVSVLVQVADEEGAAQLVVGARGLGGFEGLLMGSVSAAAARSAHCPVAVVHRRSPGAGGGRPARAAAVAP